MGDGVGASAGGAAGGGVSAPAPGTLACPLCARPLETHPWAAWRIAEQERRGVWFECAPEPAPHTTTGKAAA